jgi:hypothetical protein
MKENRFGRHFAIAIVAAALFASMSGQSAGAPWRVRVVPVNIINGTDERDSLLRIGPELGLSPVEVARIRKVSGYVGCLSPSPSVGAGALFLTNDQVLTAAHIFFEPSGRKRWKCFFRAQEKGAPRIDLLVEAGAARFGASKPKPGSNDDFAVVRLAEPIFDAVPFPVDTEIPVAAGDALIVITAHPADMDRDVPLDVPVAQPCRVRRVPISTAATSFYLTDCDASGSSSGGMHLSRVNGRLVHRGITISTGAWRDPKLRAAPYDENRKSATTALGTDAAVMKAGKALAGTPRPPQTP